jgi:hypothetical protein
MKNNNNDYKSIYSLQYGKYLQLVCYTSFLKLKGLIKILRYKFYFHTGLCINIFLF